MLLTPEDVARELSISRRQVYNLTRSGALPSIKMGHRTVRVKREALEEYIRGKAA